MAENEKKPTGAGKSSFDLINAEKFFLELPRPDENDRQADTGRLLRAMDEQYDERHIHINLYMMQQVDHQPFVETNPQFHLCQYSLVQ